VKAAWRKSGVTLLALLAIGWATLRVWNAATESDLDVTIRTYLDDGPGGYAGAPDRIARKYGARALDSLFQEYASSRDAKRRQRAAYLIAGVLCMGRGRYGWTIGEIEGRSHEYTEDEVERWRVWWLENRATILGVQDEKSGSLGQRALARRYGCVLVQRQVEDRPSKLSDSNMPRD